MVLMVSSATNLDCNLFYDHRLLPRLPTLSLHYLSPLHSLAFLILTSISVLPSSRNPELLTSLFSDLRREAGQRRSGRSRGCGWVGGMMLLASVHVVRAPPAGRPSVRALALVRRPVSDTQWRPWPGDMVARTEACVASTGKPGGWS